MVGLEGLRLPRELLELGPPQKVYRSHPVTRAMRWTTNIFGTLSILAGAAILYLVALARVVPEEPRGAKVVAYVVGFAFLGSGLLMHLSLWWMKRTPPKYLYAFYPQGLVTLQRRQWGVIPWRRVVELDEIHGPPGLVLEDRSVFTVLHNFPNGSAFMEDLRIYVAEKDRQLGIVPATPYGPNFYERRIVPVFLGCLLLLGAGATAYLTWDWLAEGHQPPLAMTHDDLVKLGNVDHLAGRRVAIDVPQVIKSNVELAKSRFNIVSVTESQIVVIPIKDQYLIANVRNDFKGGKNVEGRLSVWRGDGGRYSKVMRDAAEMVTKDNARYKDKLLSFQFDATLPFFYTAKALAAGLVVVAVLGLIFILKALVSGEPAKPKVVV